VLSCGKQVSLGVGAPLLIGTFGWTGARLVVLEHVRGTGRFAHWQDRITPIWFRLAAGCAHLGQSNKIMLCAEP
jgi:hypothetical protein